MKVTILGCGTSTGVPVIGCTCSVCKSDEIRNVRSRASIVVEVEGKSLLVDTSTDLRSQALNVGLNRVDAVLFTHMHADHVHGIDELRTFNFLQKSPIPCFAAPETTEQLQEKFDYIFHKEEGKKNWVPNLDLSPVKEAFDLFGTEIVPLKVEHGSMPTFGYLFNRRLAYLTDCKTIPEESKRWLGDLDVLILDALRFEPHRGHMTIDEALGLIEELKPTYRFQY